MGSMTIQRFQSIVLKLGNKMFVRHYLWLNYPNDPQMIGIQFTQDILGSRLATEISELGFRYDAADQIWKIERSTEETHPLPHPVGVEA